MSDHDPTRDPIDEAYDQAETALSDEAARAARRARVLAAVTRDQAEAPAASRLAAWRPMLSRMPREGWLAASLVVGFSLFLATRLLPVVTPMAPASKPELAAQPAPAAVGPAEDKLAVRPPPHARVARAARKPVPVAPRLQARPATVLVAKAAPPPSVIAPAPQAFPAAPAMDAPRDVVVTGRRAATAEVGDRRGQGQASRADSDRAEIAGGGAFAAPPPSEYARPQTQTQPAPAPAFEYAAPAPPPPPPPPPPSPVETRVMRELAIAPAPSSPEQIARLAAAAAAGHASEVERLLAQGVPVDGRDAHGDTALMRSVRDGRADIAALLVKHGASLDLRNKAGRSARDMANGSTDPELRRALGLDPR